MNYLEESDIRKSIVCVFGHSLYKWKKVRKVLKKMIEEEKNRKANTLPDYKK